MTDPIPKIEPPEMLHPRRGMMQALILITLTLVLFAVVGIYLQYRPIPFDPIEWRNATSGERARMLESLLEQTDFIGYPRDEVEFYLGPAEFDERMFWYDLGDAQGDPPVDPRGDVGDPNRLYGVFLHDKVGAVIEVLYSHRRPVLGSVEFDSTAWAGATPAGRRTMFTSALRALRGRGLNRTAITQLLGDPDGRRIRGEYDVGPGLMPYGSKRALVLDYNESDVVDTSFIQK